MFDKNSDANAITNYVKIYPNERCYIPFQESILFYCYFILRQFKKKTVNFRVTNEKIAHGKIDIPKPTRLQMGTQTGRFENPILRCDSFLSLRPEKINSSRLFSEKVALP